MAIRKKKQEPPSLDSLMEGLFSTPTGRQVRGPLTSEHLDRIIEETERAQLEADEQRISFMAADLAHKVKGLSEKKATRMIRKRMMLLLGYEDVES